MSCLIRVDTNTRICQTRTRKTRVVFVSCTKLQGPGEMIKLIISYYVWILKMRRDYGHLLRLNKVSDEQIFFFSPNFISHVPANDASCEPIDIVLKLEHNIYEWELEAAVAQHDIEEHMKIRNERKGAGMMRTANHLPGDEINDAEELRNDEDNQGDQTHKCSGTMKTTSEIGRRRALER
ncbi:hypothetical protein LXL04_011944 [Taraxacum kok-saghyz]